MLAGALKLTVACALAATAPMPVGAPGTFTSAAGVTAFEAFDALLFPAELLALTVKV